MTNEQIEARKKYQREYRKQKYWASPENRLKDLAASKKYREENSERLNKYSKEYYKANKQKALEYNSLNKEWQYRLRIFRRFGITPEIYDEMFKTQGGLCAICHQPETKKLKGKVISLAIDHNHKTGKIRKLLCHKCNVAIGLLDENKDRILNCHKYLESHE